MAWENTWIPSTISFVQKSISIFLSFWKLLLWQFEHHLFIWIWVNSFQLLQVLVWVFVWFNVCYGVGNCPWPTAESWRMIDFQGIISAVFGGLLVVIILRICIVKKSRRVLCWWGTCYITFEFDGVIDNFSFWRAFLVIGIVVSSDRWFLHSGASEFEFLLWTVTINIAACVGVRVDIVVIFKEI